MKLAQVQDSRRTTPPHQVGLGVYFFASFEIYPLLTDMVKMRKVLVTSLNERCQPNVTLFLTHLLIPTLKLSKLFHENVI